MFIWVIHVHGKTFTKLTFPERSSHLSNLCYIFRIKKNFWGFNFDSICLNATHVWHPFFINVVARQQDHMIWDTGYRRSWGVRMRRWRLRRWNWWKCWRRRTVKSVHSRVQYLLEWLSVGGRLELTKLSLVNPQYKQPLSNIYITSLYHINAPRRNN